MAVNSFKIYSGYDNSASLVNVESLTVSGDTCLTSLGSTGRLYLLSSALSATASYFIIESKTLYRRNYEVSPYPNARGGISLLGYDFAQWRQPFMTLKAYEYIRTNYIENGTNGNLVTIATNIDSSTSYVNKNAILSLPPLTDFSFEDGTKTQLQDGTQILFNVLWSFKIKGTAS